MKTLELQTIWWEWLSTADKLTRILHEQTAALTLRDVARIERIQPDLDVLLRNIQILDQKAVACTQRLADTLGTESHVRSLVRVLEKTESMKLQETANKVIVTARNITYLMDKNRTLIQKEMAYINGTISLIGKTVNAQEKPLGRRAVSTAVLLDQAA